jgi:uncharacterized ferritin-like protein (DUF455 family)
MAAAKQSCHVVTRRNGRPHVGRVKFQKLDALNHRCSRVAQTNQSYIIARFPDVEMPIGFYDDWVKCADEESKHFNLMADCLEELGSFYGALPAHAGMWQAAQDTAKDFMGRLAVVPMVLEARGLDVTPKMIYLFKQAKQKNAVAALETIYAEEVAHVAYGSKWFHFLCGRNNLDPKPVFHGLVTTYFHSTLKPPFNEDKRAEAGIPPDFYWPLAVST